LTTFTCLLFEHYSEILI